MSIARPAHRDLLHSALTCILPAALAVGAVVLLWTLLLELSGLYVVKAVTVFIAGAVLVLLGLPKHHPFQSIGPANQATVVRGALVALLAGLIGERTDTGAPAIATAMAVIASVLDGVDGWFARRTNMTSRFGARFDMETDAVLIMVLAMLAYQFGKAGIWVLLSGLLRYAFIASGAALPSLCRPLPPSNRRKCIAVVQMVALIVAIAPFVSPMWSAYVAAIALLMLAASFFVDILWLLRDSAQQRVTVPE